MPVETQPPVTTVFAVLVLFKNIADPEGPLLSTEPENKLTHTSPPEGIPGRFTSLPRTIL